MKKLAVVSNRLARLAAVASLVAHCGGASLRPAGTGSSSSAGDSGATSLAHVRFVPILGHANQVMDSAVSGDGRLLVTGAIDGSARLWDLQTLSPLAIFDGLEAEARSVALAPDARS